MVNEVDCSTEFPALALHIHTRHHMFLRASTLTLESTWRLLCTASCALHPHPCHTLRGISTTANAAAAGLKSDSGTALRFYKQASVVNLPEVRLWCSISVDQRCHAAAGGIWRIPRRQDGPHPRTDGAGRPHTCPSCSHCCRMGVSGKDAHPAVHHAAHGAHIHCY